MILDWAHPAITHSPIWRFHFLTSKTTFAGHYSYPIFLNRLPLKGATHLAFALQRNQKRHTKPTYLKISLEKASQFNWKQNLKSKLLLVDDAGVYLFLPVDFFGRLKVNQNTKRAISQNRKHGEIGPNKTESFVEWSFTENADVTSHLGLVWFQQQPPNQATNEPSASTSSTRDRHRQHFHSILICEKSEICGPESEW